MLSRNFMHFWFQIYLFSKNTSQESFEGFAQLSTLGCKHIFVGQGKLLQLLGKGQNITLCSFDQPLHRPKLQALSCNKL